MLQVDQVTIIGTGLLGTSIGLALRAAGFAGRIVGVGRRQATVEKACALGGVDRASTDLAEVLPDSQLAIVCVPLGRFATLLEQIARHDHHGLIITDVGSAKGCVLDAAHRFLPFPERFVGSHPMAGSERQGPDAARADLFQAKPCIITPEPDTALPALRAIESLWSTLGMSVIRMSARQHDRKTAVISHLPHALAVLLVRVATERGGWEIASTGFRDTTRLASSNPPMRVDIMVANRDEIIDAVDGLRDQLHSLRTTLADGDAEALRDLLHGAKSARDAWLAGQKP